MLASQGWGAWPVCSVQAGATGSSSSAGSSSSSTSTSSSSSGSSRTSATVEAPVAAATERPAAVETTGTTYTVRLGDSLSIIAKRLDIDAGWQRLWAANPTVSDADVILVGQQLQLPV